MIFLKKEKINEKKENIGKLKNKSKFEKKRKKRKKKKDSKKKEKKKESTVDYCCNPQCFWMWRNSDSPTPFRYQLIYAKDNTTIKI